MFVFDYLDGGVDDEKVLCCVSVVFDELEFYLLMCCGVDDVLFEMLFLGYMNMECIFLLLIVGYVLWVLWCGELVIVEVCLMSNRVFALSIFGIRFSRDIVEGVVMLKVDWKMF